MNFVEHIDLTQSNENDDCKHTISLAVKNQTEGCTNTYTFSSLDKVSRMKKTVLKDQELIHENVTFTHDGYVLHDYLNNETLLSMDIRSGSLIIISYTPLTSSSIVVACNDSIYIIHKDATGKELKTMLNEDGVEGWPYFRNKPLEMNKPLRDSTFDRKHIDVKCQPHKTTLHKAHFHKESSIDWSRFVRHSTSQKSTNEKQELECIVID
jgi:hypothetical protein